MDLVGLMTAIAAGDHSFVRAAAPSLATARLARDDEFFLEALRAQLYEGDTALHAAALAYDVESARVLLAHGAGVRARNRRGGEPLHAATAGEPGSARWNPPRQRAVIEYLVAAGADPDATALGGVTALHRAVRNRCSAAVDALLRAGADPGLANDNGSRPADLARRATGRGGVGGAAAKAEQLVILDLLASTTP